jgi:hypothetical protein
MRSSFDHLKFEMLIELFLCQLLANNTAWKKGNVVLFDPWNNSMNFNGAKSSEVSRPFLLPSTYRFVREANEWLSVLLIVQDSMAGCDELSNRDPSVRPLR